MGAPRSPVVYSDGHDGAYLLHRAARIRTPVVRCRAPFAAIVSRLTVESRQDVLGGRTFGTAGEYEKLAGMVEFALDPNNAANASIVDLARAPRDANGRVIASANFMILRPKTMPRDRAVALLEVSNRGGKAALPYFARAAWSADPTAEAAFGDALPLRLGLTLIWVGWQFDVPLRDGAMRLDAPVASDGGRPIEGLVRSDWTVDERVATLPLGHRNHRPYSIADPAHPDNVLTERDGRLATRRVVPRDQWRFVDETRIARAGGFEPGKIYELVYRARDPVVVGMGLAAVRDLMSYAKYDPSSPFPVRWGLGLGISQTGRFLRHLVYQASTPMRRDARSSTASSCTPPAPGAAASTIGSRNPRVTRIGSPRSSIRPTSSRSAAEASAIRRRARPTGCSPTRPTCRRSSSPTPATNTGAAPPR